MRSPWHITYKATAVALVIMAVIAMSGCTTTREVPVERIVERKVEVPANLLTCAKEPVAGTVWVSQKDVASYMVKLAAAGEDCRRKLDAVRRLVEVP